MTLSRLNILIAVHGKEITFQELLQKIKKSAICEIAPHQI